MTVCHSLVKFVDAEVFIAFGLVKTSRHSDDVAD